ncbi:porin [Paraburkholderia sp. JHI869]|uniref:porin n=1 Tax=Paraburkholderia sp. JHI869 TaxID=3112959 RepID=UPI00316E85D0
MYNEMRKIIIASFFVGTGICSVAHAQSSVTLYGRLDSGLDFISNVAQPNGTSRNLFRYGNNQYCISWWGLQGSEDLGSGFSAVFRLESMFSAGSGSLPTDALFGRYAYVGVASDKYGSLWLGRVMALTDETGWFLDPFGEQATGIANLAKGRAWGSRANTVTYNSNKYGGFNFRLQNGFGNQAGNFRGSRQLSASAAYTLTGLSLYGVYEEIRDANGKFSSLYEASQEYMVGATYSWGPLKFYGGYQQLWSSGSDTTVTADNPLGATRNSQEWVGLNYQATDALQLIAAAYHASVNHNGGSATLGAIGANYSLSKRTLLYSTVGMMFNHGNAAFPVEAQDSPPLPGHNQQGFYFGINHFF